jgi:aspartate-semialdehyde dehydrogenase
MDACHLAVVGATGLVGQEVLRIVEERGFSVSILTLLASDCSAGSRAEFRGRSTVVRELSNGVFDEVDTAIFAADAEASRHYARQAAQAGAVVIDCSSAFRLHPHVPLCVPEINPEVLQRHHGIIAIPHGMTTQLALALAPLHAEATLARVVVSTYQSASGRGRHAVRELDQQLRDLLNFRPAEAEAFPHQLAFNCLPQGGAFLDNGYGEEEMALIDETRKLLAAPDLPVGATVVYVPLAHGHSASVYVETERTLSVPQVRELLDQAPGVEVEDDCREEKYPLAIHANGQDEVFVGRIRADLSVPNGLHLWAVADNLRKGAALNAVQIAEHLAH